MEAVVSLPTLEVLRQFVKAQLCLHDHLDPKQTPLYQGVIARRGRPCGLFFQVQGPRLLKTYALWTGDENRIIFYDSHGARFGECQLIESPDPLRLAA
jgi:hypothetical protein